MSMGPSEDDICRRRGTVKSVKLPPISTANGFRKSQQEMCVQACASSNRSQKRSMVWLTAVEGAQRWRSWRAIDDDGMTSTRRWRRRSWKSLGPPSSGS